MYIITSAAVFTIVLLLITRFYRKRWSHNLDLSIRFGSDGLYEGERGQLLETITNRKLLPILWGNIQFLNSHNLHFDGINSDHDYYKKDTVSAFSYWQVTKTLPFTAKRRGFYRIDNVELVSGDLLFKYKFIRRFPIYAKLYVYPSIKDANRFNIDFKKIIGEVISRRSLVEDPFVFRGIRDYYPFDSMKTVNWNATARTGTLKVNNFHCTASQEVKILLDFDGYNKWDGQEIKEDLIRIAACLADRLLANGIATGLVTNAIDSEGGKIDLMCQSGRGQLLNLMRKMAKIDTDKLICPFDDILTSIIKSGDSRPQYILISYYTKAYLVQKVAAFEGAGLSLQWIVLHDKSRILDLIRRKNMTICEVEY